MSKIFTPVPQAGNRLLSCLPPAQYQRLSQLMQAVSFRRKQPIYKLRGAIDYVYFPTGGIVSAMAVMKDGAAIEVATIGSEGMVGLSAFIGCETSPYEVMVQVPGQGLRLRTETFRKEVANNDLLRKILIDYHTAFSTQVSYLVACNGLHTVEKRCCRWLLVTQDRIGSSTLQLTHEFLAIMLGVRRATVTLVLKPLQELGLVRNGRGQIEILDRAGLEQHACECYQAINKEFARLFKWPGDRGGAIPRDPLVGLGTRAKHGAKSRHGR